MCTETCPCHVSDSTSYKGSKYSDMVVKPDGYTDLLGCPAETLSKGHESKFAPFLRAMESEFDCAGICSLPDYYLFSTVNKGPPQALCKDMAIEYVHAQTSSYAGFCFLAAALGATGLAYGMSICHYNKNRSSHSWEQYQQMKF